MKYRVKAGRHCENGVFFRVGDVFDTSADLTAFTEKFVIIEEEDSLITPSF